MSLLPRVTLRATALVAAAILSGCAPAIGPAVQDAQIAMAVRTALVNDPSLGTYPIDVRVAAGVVTLLGVVPSDADARRAADLVRGVAGVRDVTPALQVGPVPTATPVPVPQASGVARPGPSSPLRLIALGISATGARTHDTGLGDALAVGPSVRLPDRSGLGPAIGFTWTEVDVEAGPRGQAGLATLTLRPVMAGLAYNIAHDRGVVSASIVGGYAFNSLAADRRVAGAGRAIGVRGAPAWRAGVSTWYDVGSRIGLHLFVGGLFARPRVTFATDEAVWTEKMRADALIISVGVAYWLF